MTVVELENELAELRALYLLLRDERDDYQRQSEEQADEAIKWRRAAELALMHLEDERAIAAVRAELGEDNVKGDLSDLVARSIMLDRLEADYQYRRSTRWGRFLLWLLRKTT